jgi:UDP-N-acetylmuramate--alanine ligase
MKFSDNARQLEGLWWTAEVKKLYAIVMHVFFSGIGGAGIGPLALIAKQAGYDVSGSDKQDSSYVRLLEARGATVTIGQAEADISKLHEQKPIDWFVYSSALPKENPNHPELVFCQQNGIKSTKRDDFINQLLSDKQLKMIAIAGTHGKTTTTAMTVWLFKRLNLPISYSVGAKLSFGEPGEFREGSEYFVYEADEYDRNFLAFHPRYSIIPGIAWDHPDIYPTKEEYNQAFVDFISQSRQVFAHPEDMERIGQIGTSESISLDRINLAGEVNRKNAQLVVAAVAEITKKSADDLLVLINQFPGLSRRFERIAENVYSDYAHTPEKIAGALQLAHEVAGDNVVIIYEGLHNTRQHFIKKDLAHLFDDVKKLYIVPSYLAREDESLEMLTPEKLIALTSKPENAEPRQLDDQLKATIESHQKANSLDEWLRQNFS